MKNNKEERIPHLFLLILAIIVPLVLSISYGYVQAKNNNKDIIMRNEEYDIKLQAENEGHISALDLILINSENIAKESNKNYFKVVTGNNKQYITYSLTLSELTISANLQSSDFKWQLTRNKIVVGNGDFKNTKGNSLLLAANLQIDKNTIEEFELKIWLEKADYDQQKLLKGTFSGKITIISET